MTTKFLAATIVLLTFAASASAGLRPGDQAPAFSEKAADGSTHALADYTTGGWGRNR